MPTNETTTRKRSAKRDCLECKFSGVIRLPINASDVSTITAANAEMTARVEAIKKAAGATVNSENPKFGKMGA